MKARPTTPLCVTKTKRNWWTLRAHFIPTETRNSKPPGCFVIFTTSWENYYAPNPGKVDAGYIIGSLGWIDDVHIENFEHNKRTDKK